MAKNKIIENERAWVEVYYRDKYKTAIYQEPCFYLIVTRVNYSTAKLWLQIRKMKALDYLEERKLRKTL